MRLFKGSIALVGGILALRGAFAIDIDPESQGMSNVNPLGSSSVQFRSVQLSGLGLF
jgi:hypothetical protein